MTLQHGLKVAIFAMLGFAYGPWLAFIGLMIAAGFLGTLVGRSVLVRLSDKGFKKALDIVLIDARTGKFIGGVKSGSRNNVTYRSNGVRLFHTSGRYQLRISSSLARWRIKIEQLTEEEAELYTPANAN